MATKLLWVTNLPAPYRFKIWDRLAEVSELNVIFLLSSNNWRKWKAPISPKWKFNFLNFRHFRFGEVDLILGIRLIRKYVLDSEIIVVTGWEAPVYFYVLYLAKKNSKTLAIFYESNSSTHNFKNIVVKSARRFYFNQIDLIITPGNTSTHAILDMGIPKDKIVTLFNPIDVNRIAKYVSKLSREKSNGHSFIFVGRFVPLKNIRNIILAFSDVREPEDKLVLIGSGKLENELRRITYELGICSQVKFIGERYDEDLLENLAFSNTLLLPSTNEVWGMVVNEALACGLHVVVSSNCGVCDLVNSHRGVFICEVDRKSIGEKMIESRSSWKGWISEPEILNFGPDKFAQLLFQNLSRF